MQGSTNDTPGPPRPSSHSIWESYANRVGSALLGSGRRPFEPPASRPPEDWGPSETPPSRPIFARRSAWILALTAVVASQLSYLSIPSLAGFPDFVTYLLDPLVLLGLLVFFVRLNGARMADAGFWTSVGTLPLLSIGVGLGCLYVAVQLEPGVLFGFSSSVLPSSRAFALVLLTSPVVAAAQEGTFRGFFLRTVSATHELASGTYQSAGLFALAATPFSVIVGLGISGLIQYLFTTVLELFAVGLVASVFFYKSSWSLWGVIAFRSVQIVQTELFQGLARSPNWTVPFVFVLVACVAVLAILLLLWPEPRGRTRRFLGEPIGPRIGRFRERSRLRHEAVVTMVTVGLLAGALGGAFATYAETTDIRTPFLAIPTGSMVPAIEPGDLVVLAPVSSTPIPVGTIIAYSTTCLPLSPVVHRVIAEHRDPNGTYVYITKGDHNTVPDPCPVPASHVIGKVSAILPDLGIFILQPGVGIALVICVAAASFVIAPRRRPRRGVHR